MAKMIIDIPDAVIDDIKATYEGLDVVYDAVKFGKVLPYRATNGDVIKALFLHKDIEIDEHKNYTQMYYTDSYITFPSSWWNAPYKVGDTDVFDK